MLKAWVDFSLIINIYCGNLMNFMEVNLIKPWGLYYGWVFLEFLTLRLAYIWPLDTHWPHFWCSNPCTDSSGDFHLWVYVLVNCYSLLSRVSLSNLKGSGLFSVLPFLSLFSLSSWLTQEDFLHWNLLSFYLLEWGGDSKIFTCKSRNLRSTLFFFNLVKDIRYENISILFL